MNEECNDQKLKRLTVAFVVSTLGQTGPTRQLLNLVKYLNKDSIRIRVVTLSSEPTKTLKLEFDALDIPVYCLGLGRIYSMIRGPKALHKILLTFRPDIIHSQGIRSDLFSAKLTNYSHRIATQRNIPEHDYPLLYGNLIGLLLARLHRNALARIPHIVACSTPIAVDNKMKGINSVVVGNGVDLSWCPNLPDENDRLLARQSLNLPHEGRVIVYAGPMIRRKNPDFLIKSFLEWPQNSDHQLCLLGGGPLVKTCRHLAQNSPNIFIGGHMSEISHYLRAADVFISASTSEGIPNSILEALAFGLPLILSDIPSHRHIIEKDPKTGLLFPLGDASAFSKSLELINTDETTRQAVRLLAESNYSAESMAKRYTTLYKSIYSTGKISRADR